MLKEELLSTSKMGGEKHGLYLLHVRVDAWTLEHGGTIKR